jgi:mono/diheme cytochrome c family protein
MNAMTARGKMLLGAVLVFVTATAGVTVRGAQDATTPPTSLVNALPADATGEQIFELACAACHADDGAGSPESVVGFSLPLPNGHELPDFTDCPTNTAEPFLASTRTSP